MDGYRSTMIAEFRKELVYSFFQAAIREVAGENNDVRLDHIEDAFYDALHREDGAKETLFGDIKDYVESTVEQARYNQAKDSLLEVAVSGN